MRRGKLTATLWVGVCYALALAGAWWTIVYVSLESVILKTFLADVVATAIVFVFSTIFRNASFYDPYWSVAPLPIAIYWKNYYAGTWTSIEIIVLLVIVWWSLRLTLNWYRGWEGLHHEDWRYQDLRMKTGKFFPIVNFLGIHLFPTIMVFLGCLPLVAIFIAGGFGENALFLWPQFFLILGVLFGFVAPLIQLVADEQMRTHRKNQNRTYIDTGIWKYSRHPNYLGEILFWFSICLMGFAFNSFEWWMASGFLAMILLFVFISIPLMEKRIVAKYPGFKDYRHKVSMLMPWPRKR